MGASHLTKHFHDSINSRRTFPGAAACVAAVLVIVVRLTITVLAFSADAPSNTWKPAVGKYYDLKDSKGEEWKAVDLAIGKGKAKVTFVSQAMFTPKIEHFQGVLFSGAKEVLPLPYNVGGEVRMDVYWLKGDKSTGPFLRLFDLSSKQEVLIDPQRQTASEIVREKGRVFLGDLRATDDPEKWSISIAGSGGKLSVHVNGHAAREVTGSKAAEDGKRVGEIREGDEKTTDEKSPPREMSK